MRGLLNAGHQRNRYVTRVVGNDHTPHKFALGTGYWSSLKRSVWRVRPATMMVSWSSTTVSAVA